MSSATVEDEVKERVQGALLGIGLMFALQAVRAIIPSIGLELFAGCVVMALFSSAMFYLRGRPPPDH
jgi:hypothetical protein